MTNTLEKTHEGILSLVDSNEYLIFKSETNKREFVLEMSKKFEKRGDSWTNKLNREVNIMAELVAAAKPYLKVKTVGRYLPKYVTPKGTPDQERKIKEEVASVFNHLVEKRGIIFKSPKERSEVENLLTQNFVVDLNNEGETVLRKRKDGMYSKPFAVSEVVEKFLSGKINERDSRRASNLIEVQQRDMAVYLMGFSSYKDFERNATLHDKEEYKKLLAEEKYFNERQEIKKEPIAKFNEGEYKEEIKNRRLFELGLDNEKLMTITELGFLNQHVNQKWEEINSLDNLETPIAMPDNNFNPFAIPSSHSQKAPYPADKII